MSTLNRRFFTLCCVAATFSAGAVMAQSMPPLIKLVVPYPAGGSVDMLARVIAQPLQDELKTVVVVDNKPGAGGRIAASQLSRAPGDASQIMIAPNALTTIQSLVYANQIDYKITSDFIAVSRIASYPMALAVPASSKYRTAPELLEGMRSNPNASYGTSGAGGMAHFAGIVLGKQANLEWTHISFKGGALLVTDLIGGHLPAAIDTVVDQIEQHRGGKIRILGTFGNGRYALAPDIPTLTEQGIKLNPIEGWFGAYVPAKTPAAMVARIDQSIGKVLATPDVQAKLNKMVLQSAYASSADFTKLQIEELKQWGPIVRDSGFKPE